jgi:hypothetical protein
MSGLSLGCQTVSPGNQALNHLGAHREVFRADEVALGIERRRGVENAGVQRRTVHHVQVQKQRNVTEVVGGTNTTKAATGRNNSGSLVVEQVAAVGTTTSPVNCVLGRAGDGEVVLRKAKQEAISSSQSVSVFSNRGRELVGSLEVVVEQGKIRHDNVHGMASRQHILERTQNAGVARSLAQRSRNSNDMHDFNN